jgi:KaiC/GvpD/RAD55 family RecA-like ATPase
VSATAPRPLLGLPALDPSARPADPTQSIPSELREFLNQPSPQSLLIRGPPGCGKTTLALALLESFSGTRILVTNRVAESELRHDFPWLSFGGNDPIEVVDGDRPTHGLGKSAAAIGALSTIITGAGREDVANFLWLPEEIQEAYSSLDPDRRAIVVVDSWDALVEEYMAKGPSDRHGMPAREEVERLLLAYMRRSMVTLVLIIEREVQSQLDYLVTGVVSTSKQTVDGRLERTLHLPKLRGLRIETPSYPYSLEGARFRSIRPFRYANVHFSRRRSAAQAGEPPAEEMSGRIWPGSTDFAAEFGVFDAGTTTVIEADAEVPFPIISLLVEPPIVQTLAAGGRVLLIPPPGTRPDDLYLPYRAVLPAETLAAHLRIFSVAGTEGVRAEAHPCILPLPREPRQGTDPVFHVAYEFIREAGPAGVPNLIVRTASGQRALAQQLGLPVSPENFAWLAAAYVANLVSHQIVVGNIGDPLLEALNDLGSLRLQLRARQGRYFLNGVRPFTSSFAVTEGDSVSPYQLIRMV